MRGAPEQYRDEQARLQEPGRLGRATIKLLRKLDWIGEDSELNHERGREFFKTLSLLLAVNLSAVGFNTANQIANGDRELLNSQKWMDAWDVGFPVFFVMSRKADMEGKYYKAAALRTTAYMGHAAVAALGGAQTYGAMQEGLGETSESLALSGATGVANMAMFVREVRRNDDEATEEERRNRAGLWASVASNTAESAGGLAGAGLGAVTPPDWHASGYSGLAMSGVVGVGMAAAGINEVRFAHRQHKRRRAKTKKHQQRAASAFGGPDYGEFIDNYS